MGSGAEKRAGSEEVRCVAGTAPALLHGVRGHFILGAHRIPLIAALVLFGRAILTMISKYKSSSPDFW